MIARTLLALALSASLASCTGAASPTGECLGYSCDEAGARALMEETLASKFEPSPDAKASLEVVFERGLETMAREGFQPDGFDLAKANLTRFLSDVPDQGQDALATDAAALANKTAKACPLWPYC